MIGSVHRLSDEYPVQAYCFIIANTEETKATCADVYKLVSHLCDQNIPHNVFFTGGTFNAASNVIRVFVFPRKNICESKQFVPFNIAFCELSGYVPVGSEYRKTAGITS